MTRSAGPAYRMMPHSFVVNIQAMAGMLALAVCCIAAPLLSEQAASAPDESENKTPAADVTIPQATRATFQLVLFSTKGPACDGVSIDPATIKQVKDATKLKNLTVKAAGTTTLELRQKARVSLAAYTVEIVVRNIRNTVQVSLSIQVGGRKLVNKQIIRFGRDVPIIQKFVNPDGSGDVILIRLNAIK